MSRLAELLRVAQALVFDFDGTLVDSNRIKQRAFERCFSEFPHRLDEIIAYCGRHHHTPRWEKFRHVYESILGLPYTQAVETALSRRFDEETTHQIIHAAEIPGATTFLKLVRHRYVTALLSSTPHEVLLQILAARDWLDYFKYVQGAPVDKAAWLKEFRTKHGLNENGVVFFGDTQEDGEAALTAGCAFVGVGTEPPGVATIASIPDFTVVIR